MAPEQKPSGRGVASVRGTSQRKSGRSPAARKVAVPEPSWEPVPGEPPATEVPAPGGPQERARLHEPVWLVRIVLVLFLVGFAAFLAREIRNFVSVLP